jgi:LPXTG-motif cell wall-anchored protein
MYGSQVGGTFAAALLGVSGAIVAPTPQQTTRVAAAEITRQLATTGTSMTVALAVVAALFLLMGVLLVSLSRRHAPRHI